MQNAHDFYVFWIFAILFLARALASSRSTSLNFLLQWFTQKRHLGYKSYWTNKEYAVYKTLFLKIKSNDIINHLINSFIANVYVTKSKTESRVTKSKVILSVLYLIFCKILTIVLFNLIHIVHIVARAYGLKDFSVLFPQEYWVYTSLQIFAQKAPIIIVL